MSIRIYVLAKQLKLDNKALVDICNKLGITGKGSALASLSDEEVAAIKAHLSSPKKSGVSGAASREGAAGAGEQLRREDYIAPAGTLPKKVPVLGRKPEALPSKKPGPLAEPAVEATVEPLPSAEEAPGGIARRSTGRGGGGSSPRGAAGSAPRSSGCAVVRSAARARF